MQSAKTGRPTFEKSFRNSGEASACSSKQRYPIERQLECRPYLVSTRFRFQHSCHAASQPSDICRRSRSKALGPFDLALSLSGPRDNDLGGTQRVEARHHHNRLFR